MYRCPHQGAGSEDCRNPPGQEIKAAWCSTVPVPLAPVASPHSQVGPSSQDGCALGKVRLRKCRKWLSNPTLVKTYLCKVHIGAQLFFSWRKLLSIRRPHIKIEESGKEEGAAERNCCDLTLLSSQWCRKWRCCEWRNEFEPGKGREERCCLDVYFLFLTTYIHCNSQWIKLIFCKLRLFTPDSNN